MVQLVSLLIPNMLKMEPNVNMLFGMNSFKQMQVFFFFFKLAHAGHLVETRGENRDWDTEGRDKNVDEHQM